MSVSEITMNKEDFYKNYILEDIPEDEKIKRYVINECRRMDKADVYEWCASNEVKNKTLAEENTNLKQALIDLKEILGQYKHYYLPDENQNSKNEDLVERSYTIIDKVLGGSDE